MAYFSKSEKSKKLRQTATKQLKDGSAPPSHHLISSEALSSLFGLSSAPGNAKDVLALLHELQVHQVELDLQYEQLEENTCELVHHGISGFYLKERGSR